MIVLKKGDVEEHQFALKDSSEDFQKAVAAEKGASTIRKNAKELVNTVADTVGSDKVRVIIPIFDETGEPTGKVWDRRVSERGGGFDEERLKALLGNKEFHKLCDRTVTYTLNPVKLDLARKDGALSEEVLAQTTVEPAKTYSVYLTDEEKIGEN